MASPISRARLTAAEEESRETWQKYQQAASRGSSKSPVPPEGTAAHARRTRALKDLTFAEICALLRSLELSRYASAFAQAGYVGADLELATEEDLLSIGVDVPVHRRRLMMLVKEYATSGIPVTMLEPHAPTTPAVAFAVHSPGFKQEGIAGLRLVGQPPVTSPLRRRSDAAVSPMGKKAAFGGASSLSTGGLLSRAAPRSFPIGGSGRLVSSSVVEARLEEAVRAAQDATRVASAAHEARLVAETELSGVRSERDAFSRMLESLEEDKATLLLACKKAEQDAAAQASAAERERRRAEEVQAAAEAAQRKCSEAIAAAKEQAEMATAALAAATGGAMKPLMEGSRPHEKARSQENPTYPQRFPVSAAQISWDTPFAEYLPPEFTADVVFKNDRDLPTGHKWADPADVASLRGELEARVTYSLGGERTLKEAVRFDDTGAPINPVGRTGLRGRGLLGKWGPNYAADPIVTRFHPTTGQLQMIAIQRQDTKQWAIPGGMVDSGEEVSVTIRREFKEETGNLARPEDAEAFDSMTKELFRNGVHVYRGYVDDPRNTDNAWIETSAFHFHCTRALGEMLPLHAGDDAAAVQWIDVDAAEERYANLYAAHRSFVDLVAKWLLQSPIYKEVAAWAAALGRAQLRHAPSP